MGDAHWADANLRGARIEALEQRAAARAGSKQPILGPALGAAARVDFVAHLSRRDRADLAAYEHAEHVAHDGVDAVKRERADEDRRRDHHHSLFSVHTVASAGRSVHDAAEDLGGMAIHAIAHAPETIKKAAIGAYHYPLEAGKIILDAVGFDSDDIAGSLDDIRHGRIKHLVLQRLKTHVGYLIRHPESLAMPVPMAEWVVTRDARGRGDPGRAERRQRQRHAPPEAAAGTAGVRADRRQDPRRPRGDRRAALVTESTGATGRGSTI